MKIPSIQQPSQISLVEGQCSAFQNTNFQKGGHEECIALQGQSFLPSKP